MKKIVYTLLLTVLPLLGFAQNEEDVLRYSQQYLYGSARSLGMGGANGAIGADLGSLSGNPAGLGVYRAMEISFTPDYSINSTKTNFLTRSYTDQAIRFGVDNFGVVVPLKSPKESGLFKSLNFGFAYNKLNDYKQNFMMEGVNNASSLVDEFEYTANLYDEWDPFTDGLAWETYLIDYDSISDSFYSDFTNSEYGQIQQRTSRRTGRLSEYALSLGGNFTDKVYLGASLGLQRLSYEEHAVHSEMDPENVIDFFDSFSYTNVLIAEGSGVNFKVGAIFKPVSWLRIGAAVHTPTAIEMSEGFSASMEADFEDGEPSYPSSYYGDYDYEITSPFKSIGSLGLVLGKLGLISLDYEYVDYSMARIRSADDAFYDINQNIQDRYKPTSNIRIGGEFKMGLVGIRAGYAFYGSPYQNGEVNASSNHQYITAGLGIKDKNYFLDIAYVRSINESTYYLYYQTPALLNQNMSRFVATIGFRF